MRKRVIILKMSLLLVCLSVRAQTVMPAHVSIDILGFDTYNGVAIACKHNPQGSFQATHAFAPDPRVETIISGPRFAWTISPKTPDVSFSPTNQTTVQVKMENDAACGKEYSVKIVATWKVRITATGKEDNVSDSAIVTLVALKVELIPTSPREVVYDDWRPVSWAFQLLSGISVPLPYLSYYLNSNDPDPIVKEITDSIPQTVPRPGGGDTFLVQHDRGSYSGTALVSGKVLCDRDNKKIYLAATEGDYIYVPTPTGPTQEKGESFWQSDEMAMEPGSTHVASFSEASAHGIKLGFDIPLPAEWKFKPEYQYTHTTTEGGVYSYPYVDYDGAAGSDSILPDATNEKHISQIVLFKRETPYKVDVYVKKPDGTRGEFIETYYGINHGVLVDRIWKPYSN